MTIATSTRARTARNSTCSRYGADNQEGGEGLDADIGNWATEKQQNWNTGEKPTYDGGAGSLNLAP